MSTAVGIETGFNEEASGCDDCEYAENQHRRNASGKLSDIPQVIRFLSKRIDNHLPETFKIGEW
jgi:hypothetical protein